MSFSTILDAFKGLFSRSYWFGSFLPVAIVAMAHAGLAAWVFKYPLATQLDTLVKSDPGRSILVIAGLVFLAYALGPLTAFFSGLLDGSLLPASLHQSLRRSRAGQWRQQVALYRTAQLYAARAITSTATEKVRAARKGAKLPWSDASAAIIRSSITGAEALLDAIEKDSSDRFDADNDPARAIDVKQVKEAANTLVAALEQDIGKLSGLEPTQNWQKRADSAGGRIDKLSREAVDETSHRFAAVVRRLPNLDLYDWQPTRLGDAHFLRERYARHTYGASFAFLWPRVRMAMGDGDATDAKGMARTVTEAAALVDFAVLLLVLCLTVPAFWIPATVAKGGPVEAFLTVGIATPVVLRSLYELAIRSEMAFSAVIETAIDRYRLGVLPLLSLPLPATLSAERDIWSRLEKTSWRAAGIELVYKHAPTVSG